MAYALSEQTAQKLKQLIDDTPGSSVGPGSPVFASRITGYVKITGPAIEGTYPATIQVYDVLEATWKTKDDCLVLEANEKPLTVGDRYIAVRYGMKSSEGKSVWVAGVTLPEVDCGLFYDEEDDDKLKVYGETLAGDGINWNGDDCNFYIDPGCGITLEGGKKIGVQAGALAGEGLIARTGCKLDVLYGCGLIIEEEEDTLKVYTPDMAGQGLNASEDGCQLYIDPGCGITLEGGKKVGVHADSLAGTCLVKEEECKLGIDLTEQSGPVFSAVTAVSMYGNCYGMYLNWAVTPFSFNVNPCGLFLGFEAGEAFSSSTYVPLGCCCGDDPPPPPPPPPPPACEGTCEWNYNEETGWVLVSGGCPEGCHCPQPIDDGLPQSVATTACVANDPPPPPEGCCEGVPNTLYVTFTSGCNNLSFPITSTDGVNWYGYTGPDLDCDNNASAMLSCTNGTWGISAVASFCGPGSGTITVHSCSPFSASFTGTESGLCYSGSVSLTITE